MRLEIFIIIFLLFPIVNAQYLQDVGMLPDSPFYFLKELKRNVQLVFKFNQEKKIQLEEQFVQEKLLEYEKLNSMNKTSVSEKAWLNYQNARSRLVERLNSLEGKESQEIIQNVKIKLNEHDKIINRTRQKQNVVCIQVYDPVCGEDGKTYSNSCFASAANVRVKYKGVCNQDEKCITVIRDQAYDLTDWSSKHPGGDKAILKLCGKDGTSAFERAHGGKQKQEQTLNSFKIDAEISSDSSFYYVGINKDGNYEYKISRV
ncbi:MAG: DUF5667 domain-containing protein [Candidatus Aenigmarchaeota archaeon]|nr:DUF5667 domain-containing protein [Candidatus Aenigmarchaeota archaeon]